VSVSHLGLATEMPAFHEGPITERCGSKLGAELDLSVETTKPVASLHGFDAVYDGGSLFVPMRIIVCARKACRALDPRFPTPLP
jgi:hypothetical protein